MCQGYLEWLFPQIYQWTSSHIIQGAYKVNPKPLRHDSDNEAVNQSEWLRADTNIK